MKSSFNLFIITLLLISCTKHEDLYQHDINIDKNLELTKEFEVPVKENKITVVTKDMDTLAITDTPTTISIPRYSKISSRADELVNIDYIDYKELPKFTKGSSITSEFGILMFEDSEKADYDYNDLIVSYRMQIESGILGYFYTIRIKPIALGSTKNLAFGYLDNNNFSHYLSNDIRKDWFLDKTGFINTSKGQQFSTVIENNDKIDKFDKFFINRLLYKDHSTSNYGGYIQYDNQYANFLSFLSYGIKFFIEDEEGERFIVASRDLKVKGSLPYGLMIPEYIECYPYEKENIDIVFPNFIKWINNKNNSKPWYFSPTKEKGYQINNKNVFYIPSISWFHN